jgi:hypothetical protein
MARRGGRTGSFWPTRQQELLLRAALLDDEPSEEAWRTLRPRLDIDRLDVGSTVLLPLVYERLRERGSDDPFLPRLKGVYRYIWYRDQLALRALMEMLTALRGAGIETMVFGGAALVARYYRRAGVRPIDEPTVLVRENERREAANALREAGWAITTGGSGRHERLQRVNASDGRAGALYWRLPIDFDPVRDGPPEDVWGNADEGDVQGTSTLMLQPADELLLTCVRGARSGSTSNVQWVPDAITILRVSESEIDWDTLIAKGVARRRVLPLLDALGYLAETLDAPVPDRVLHELGEASVTARESVAYRISGRGGRLLGNLSATIGAHVVATQHESILRVVSTLPSVIRTEWGLERVSQLPAAAARRSAAAIASERAHRRERRLAQRQRSASSSGT